MANPISRFNWRSSISHYDIDKIDEDIILTDKVLPLFHSVDPFKLDVTVAIICTKGSLNGSVNLKPCYIEAPFMFVVISDHVMQFESISHDFSGWFLIMSDRFLEGLFSGPDQRLPLFFSVQDSPWLSINLDDLTSIKTYMTMLEKVIRARENPFRLETARHLIMTFFYGTGYRLHIPSESRKKTRHELLVEEFINLVKIHFNQHRGLDFYAANLRITPKHLSKVVKDSSGKTAAKWIDDVVILEAKALLKSTKMNVQQVSDALNFPSQSFFGKYFKRYTGMSPKKFQLFRVGPS